MILSIAFILFVSGLIIILYNGNNIIKVFLGVEVCLLAANWNLVYCASALGLPDSFTLILTILSVAAAEIAIGLGLIVLVFYRRGQIDLNAVTQMLG